MEKYLKYLSITKSGRKVPMDVTAIKSRISSLSNDQQYIFFNKCVNLKIPYNKTPTHVEILLSDDVIISVSNILIQVQENTIQKYSENSLIKTVTLSKYEPIPNLFPTGCNDYDTSTEVETLEVKKGDFGGVQFSPLQSRSRKKIKDCMRQISSCRKVYIEKDYGNDFDHQLEETLEDNLEITEDNLNFDAESESESVSDTESDNFDIEEKEEFGMNEEDTTVVVDVFETCTENVKLVFPKDSDIYQRIDFYKKKIGVAEFH